MSKRPNNIGEARVIAKLVGETERLHAQSQKHRRGRKPKSTALFWAIFEHHFIKNGYDEGFADYLAESMKVSKSVIYSWNTQQLIPDRWRRAVLQFMEKYGIELPLGITEDQLFFGGKISASKDEERQFNAALYAHFTDVQKAMDYNLYTLHRQLIQSNNLLNLSLLMRWIFEYGGIASTRVKLYITAMMENPYLEDLRRDYGFTTVDEGVEYAERHGWVSPIERIKD